MGLPRILYNSKQIDFIRPPNLLEILPFRTRQRNRSVSGEAETLNVNVGFTVRALFQELRSTDSTERDLKTALLDAISWVEDGGTWFLARDNAITVNTTLDGAAAAGVTSIPVTSAAGIVSGSRYVIESKTQTATVKASNTATDPVTITSPLNYGFASGARFRDYDYLPMLGSIRIIEHTYSQFYDVEITGEVERSSLAV